MEAKIKKLYILMFSPGIDRSSKKSGRNLKILGVMKVTLRDFHPEDPQILEATVQNLVAPYLRTHALVIGVFAGLIARMSLLISPYMSLRLSVCWIVTVLEPLERNFMLNE
jgi:hypothetical protein